MSSKQPSHRIYVQHDDDGKFKTEVGAVWPHSTGEGFNITLKPGIYIGGDTRIVCFKNDPERARERREERDRNGGSRRDERRDDRGRR